MRLAFYNDYDLGLVRGAEVVPVQHVVDRLGHSSPQSLIERVIADFEDLRPSFQDALDRGKGVPVAQVRLRPPLPYPAKLLCAVRNYKEDGKIPPQDQDFFLKSPSSIIGDRDTVALPPAKATIFHHEAELAFVIGKRASKVSRAEAMQYVFGYTGFVDVSARGLTPGGQRSFFMMKSWDTFGPMGPYLVTADEVPDPHNLRMRLRVNGKPRQDFSTADMAHYIDSIIEFLSSLTTLEPGDVVATGTNHQGLGALQDGDEMELEIESVGNLSNPVKDDLKREWPRGVDESTARRVVDTASH